MQSIHFEVLWTDYDGMLQLAIRASSETHTAYHETYSYPKDLMQFGEALKVYPTNQLSQAVFVSGSKEPQTHDFMQLKVFMLKSTGHSVLEFSSEVRGVPPVCAESHFFIPGFPADFNKLGAMLCDWLKNPDTPLAVEWQYA
jgi:hypothetical protein